MLFGFLIVGCLCIGLPIFIALGIGPLVELILNGEPLEGFAQTLYSGVDQYTLMAIPCFVLAGAIMGRSGITQDLVDMMKAAVGKVSGGLAIVTILACTFFAAISGSGPGTVAAVGALLIPAMKKERYDEDFAAAVSASGGVLGVLIPPSNPLIVYGVITSVHCGYRAGPAHEFPDDGNGLPHFAGARVRRGERLPCARSRCLYLEWQVFVDDAGHCPGRHLYGYGHAR